MSHKPLLCYCYPLIQRYLLPTLLSFDSMIDDRVELIFGEQRSCTDGLLSERGDCRLDIDHFNGNAWMEDRRKGRVAQCGAPTKLFPALRKAKNSKISFLKPPFMGQCHPYHREKTVIEASFDRLSQPVQCRIERESSYQHSSDFSYHERQRRFWRSSGSGRPPRL